MTHDFGFENDLASTRMASWHGGPNEAIRLGESEDPLSPSWSGSMMHAYTIEKNSPCFFASIVSQRTKNAWKFGNVSGDSCQCE